MKIMQILLAYFLVLGPLTALIALPLIFYLLHKQPKYRFSASTYILLFFGIFALFIWADVLAIHSIAASAPKTAFFLAALISLIATQAPKREYNKMFLIFVLPVLALAVINIFYTLPSQDEIVYSQMPVIRKALGTLWVLSGPWAFACFYRYCIWRIGRIRKEQVT